jgi:hypothetical protein
MSSSSRTVPGFLAPPSTSKPNRTIVIDPTSERQRFYNQTRREFDRQQLDRHVAGEDRLGPPQAEPMSRSTTSDSLPSPSTVYSYPGDSTMPSSPNPLPKSTIKGQRGKRKGPLKLDKRIKTAFKRKFKLTCEYHREKRTCCDCYDFSKLEEGYAKSLAGDQQKARAPHAAPVRPFGDLGTFGTGGAGGTSQAILQHYPAIDLLGSPTSYEPQPRVHAGLMPFVELNIDSEASVSAIVSAQREEPPYLAPTAPMPVLETQDSAIDNRVLIGCSTLSGDEWECKYQYAADETASLASTESCSWKGRFNELTRHYYYNHQHFQQANPSCTSVCLDCSAMSVGWDERRTCENPNRCSPGSWQKWYWGVAMRPLPPVPQRITASEASASRFSYTNPSWNMMSTPGSRNVGSYGFAYSSSNGYSGFYEHSTCENEVEEEAGGGDGDGDGERKGDAWYRSGGQENCSEYQFDATEIVRRCAIRRWLPLLRARRGARHAPCDPQPCAPPPPLLSSPHWRLILPLLVVFGLSGELLPARIKCALPVPVSGYCLTWYLTFLFIGLAIVALGAGGMAIGYLETTRTNGEIDGYVAVPIV